MRLPALDQRLRRIKGLLPERFDRLVDIGTDHGYLPLHLLAEYRINRALATDLRPGPLAKAKANFARFKKTELADFICCDGLANLSLYPTDCLVIAGMGGLTIADILTQGDLPAGLRCWLQPMKSAQDLLERLPACGLIQVDEQLVLSNGRFYRIIAAVKAEPGAGVAEPAGVAGGADLPGATGGAGAGLPVSPILADPARRDEETAACWPAYCRYEHRRLQKIPPGDPRREGLAYFARELGDEESLHPVK